MVNCYPYEMLKILSSYSDQVWTLARSGIVTPMNALIGNSFLCVSSCPGFTGSKLPICFVKDPLELCYGLVSSTIEIVSRVHLGISLSFWSSGLIQEKVLVFYQGDYIHCFSFSKERIVRKIRMPGLTKMCCHSSFCYLIKHTTTFELIEWKMSSGETKTIKNYTCPIELICINSKGTHLAVITSSFLEIFELTQQDRSENMSISNISSAVWAEENLVLYLSTPTVFVKVQKDTQVFTTTILLTIDLQVTEILETSGEIYLKNYNNWGKYVIGNPSLVNEPIETIDEINICHTKAEFKEFGLLYRNQNKDIHPLVLCKSLAMENSFGIDNAVMNSKKFDRVLRNPPKSFLDKLFIVAEFENSLRNLIMWKVLGEIIENNLDTSEDVVSKPRTRARENSFQGSPNNVTPARRVAKRSTSPLSKSRKSITPQRIVKLQSDPKELIQLAVDTSTLLSSTQNFQKETPPKMFYILENSPNYKTVLPTAVDFLNTDKKALVKRLIGSNDEKDMLIGCIVAGMLGRQELQKAIETACAKLEGSTGILMNLAVGSKTKAWEILQEKECSEDVAYFSKVSGRVDGFFPWIIELYESGFGFDSALHLLCAGYTGLAMQILCKINEDRLAYWICKYMENECRLKKEVPSDFEGWFYELGPPRFKSRMDEELQSLNQKYEKHIQSN